MRLELTYTGSSYQKLSSIKIAESVFVKMAVRTGFEPVISAVTGQHPKPLDERTIFSRELSQFNSQELQ